MQSLRWFSILALCLSVILTACAPATPALTPIPPTPGRTLPPTTPMPTRTLIPTLEPVGVGVPVIEYVGEQSELLVVSSLTGKPFDQFPSIPLGYYDNYAFSPDRKTLAVVSNAQLCLIDLPSWKSRTTDIDLHGPLNSAIYSADGTLLALAGGTSGGELRILDARNGEVTASTQAGFSIRDLKFTADGKALMVYGPQLASTGVAANAGVSVDAPRAALYAVSDLGMIWSIKLNGIRDGTFPKKADIANTQEIYQPGAAWHFQPGVAFAPKHDILYVAHGDKDKLTTVDFTGRKVKTVDLQHVKTSWLDRLLSLTADVAHAKGMDGTTKQAVISPDGKFLFVAGNTETVTPQANGSNWDITDTSIGLQVIDPQDGTLLDKIDTAASSVRLSPDGRQVFLIGWKEGMPFTDVYDISSKSITKHLDGMYLIPTRRLDGKAILASSNTLAGNVSYVTLLDPATWAIASEWKGTGDVGWLIDP